MTPLSQMKKKMTQVSNSPKASMWKMAGRCLGPESMPLPRRQCASQCCAPVEGKLLGLVTRCIAPLFLCKKPPKT